MRTNPILVSTLAAGLIAGSASVAFSQATTTPGAATPGATAVGQESDDDGFDLGWLGLLGLIGLAGLRGRKHETHVNATTRPRV